MYARCSSIASTILYHPFTWARIKHKRVRCCYCCKTKKKQRERVPFVGRKRNQILEDAGNDIS